MSFSPRVNILVKFEVIPCYNQFKRRLIKATLKTDALFWVAKTYSFQKKKSEMTKDKILMNDSLIQGIFLVIFNWLFQKIATF